VIGESGRSESEAAAPLEAAEEGLFTTGRLRPETNEEILSTMSTTRKKEYCFIIGEATHQITLIEESGQRRVRIDGRELEVRALPVSRHCLTLVLDGRTATVYQAGEGDRRYIGVAGRQYVLQRVGRSSAEPGSPRVQESQADASLSSPMPGQVVKILVGEDDVVEKNQTVAIVEAMKMENELRASCRARVKKISARPSDLVNAGEVIVELEAEEKK
jgi:biotin carboxyl carrier protein